MTIEKTLNDNVKEKITIEKFFPKKKKQSGKKISSNGDDDWHEAPWYDYPEDQPYEPGKRNGLPGVIRLAMSENELRKFYGQYLVPKGFTEEYILRLPFKDLEILFEEVMGI
jgi:hypothetical protein|tara:strand:+ start:700 stop:1035 length:336 start_codon:yes stop_codon:yes gene_type:complete